MNSLLMSLVMFSCILAGTFIGFYIARKLPEHHISDDSKDAVKAAWGIIATISALVLSLLLSSAKSSFDTVNSEMIQSATKIILLDQVLDSYGPETKDARLELRNRVALRIQKIWGGGTSSTTGSSALATGRGMRAVEDKLKLLTPVTDDQRYLLGQARQLTRDLMVARWLVIEQSANSLPGTFFFVLVFWLTMLFVGIGLFAPANRTVLITLIVCNLSLSAAIFLINELNRPLDGSITVSSAPMRQALDYLNHE